MTEEHIAQLWRVDVGEKTGCHPVVEMSVGCLDAGFKLFGVAAFA